MRVCRCFGVRIIFIESLLCHSFFALELLLAHFKLVRAEIFTVKNLKDLMICMTKCRFDHLQLCQRGKTN